MEDLNIKYHELALSFGEDPETLKWEDFFELLQSFNTLFEKTRTEIVQDREKMQRKEVSPDGSRHSLMHSRDEFAELERASRRRNREVWTLYCRSSVTPRLSRGDRVFEEHVL